MNRITAVWDAADGWTRIALIALTVATFAQTFFIVAYAQRPWHVLRVGRALMLKSAMLCIVLWLSLLNAFVVYHGQEAVSAAGICAVALAILYQLFVLLTTPREP